MGVTLRPETLQWRDCDCFHSPVTQPSFYSVFLGGGTVSHFTGSCFISGGLRSCQVVQAWGSPPLPCAQHSPFPFPGCHLYAVNTHHSRELRIVVAIRNKLLLITRKHSKLQAGASISLLSPLSESPVEEFQYIRVGLLFKLLLSWPRGHKADSVILQACPTVTDPGGKPPPVAQGQRTKANGASPCSLHLVHAYRCYSRLWGHSGGQNKACLLMETAF